MSPGEAADSWSQSLLVKLAKYSATAAVRQFFGRFYRVEVLFQQRRVSVHKCRVVRCRYHATTDFTPDNDHTNHPRFKRNIVVQNQTLHDVPSQWFFDGKDEVLIDACAVNDLQSTVLVERGSYSLASGSGCSECCNAAVQGEENTEMKLFVEETALSLSRCVTLKQAADHRHQIAAQRRYCGLHRSSCRVEAKIPLRLLQV